MIEISYPEVSKKETVLALPHVAGKGRYSPFEIENARIRNITPSEWRRRDNIIVKEYSKFTGKCGDTVYPIAAADYERYGAFIVRGVCGSYKDFPIEEWPDSDCPMILHIVTVKYPQEILNATVSWVTRKNPHVC